MGLFDLFGGIFGETDAQWAAKQANKLAQQDNASATNYRNQAAPGFNTLLTLGNQGAMSNGGFTPLTDYGVNNLNTAQSQLPGAISNYANIAGISNPNADPYALTPAQQAQLNGHLDELNSRQNGAISQYQAEMGRRGITDPADMAAGEAALRSNFGNMAVQHTAAYQNQVQQQRQAAQQQQIQNLMSLGQQGANTYNEGVTGPLNAIQTGASGLGNLASGASANANQQSQLAMQNTAQNNAALSSLLQIAGFGLGGGFGGSVAPQTTQGGSTTVNTPVSYDPFSSSLPGVNQNDLGY